MKNCALIGLLILVNLGAFGQAIRVTGTIIGPKGEPVPYANISVDNGAQGTASNEQGVFTIHTILLNDTDTLAISCIGYKTKRIPLSSIEKGDNLTIQLEEHTLTISGLTVYASDQNAKKIVEKALTNYRNNYTHKKYQLKGFYRQMLRNDSSYVMLTEGAFTMNDKGYRKKDVKKLRLDALRKSDDMRDMDSLDVHYDSLIEHNDLLGMFSGDHIDAEKDSWSFYSFPNFNPNILDNYNFLLDGITYYDGQEVYKISFSRKKNYGNRNYDYTLYIQRKSYAVVEMRLTHKAKEVTYSTNDKLGNVGRLIEGKYYYKKVIQYQFYQGKWFPKYISSHSSVIGGDRQKSSRLAYQRARGRGDSKLEYTGQALKGKIIDPDKNNYFQFKEMLITNVKNHEQKIDRISKKELMMKEKYVRNHRMDYDADFWKNYSTIPLNPYLKAAQKHLKESDKFNSQF